MAGAVSNKKPGFLPKKWQRVILILVFVAANAAIIIATAVNEFGNSANAAALSEVQLNWWMLIPATLCFIVMIYLEYWKYVTMLVGTTKPKTFSRSEAWKLSRRTVMLGRYYDRITPASVGGQPFQIYHLNKTGKLSHGLSAAIPIFSMISGQATFILIAIPCFLFGGILQSNPALLSLAWLGLLFFAFWPALVAGMAFFPKPTTRLFKFATRVLARLHIVKNREKALEKIEHDVGDYVKYVRQISKAPKVFGGVMVMSLLSNILVSFIPYFVLKAFGGDMNFGDCFVLTMAVQSAIYFVPTPGNAGAAEGTFYLVFSALSTGYVFWAMLTWRFFSYYVYIIGGAFEYLTMHIEKRKGNDHQKQD